MSTDKKDQSGGSNMNFLFIIGLVLAILTIIFAIQNADRVPIEFFSFSIQPHLALLIISCILLGSILTLLFSIPGWMRNKKATASIRTKLKKLQKNYDELAAIQKTTKTP